jgi:ABC-type uncharacterized transport system involved in gliding motility auxiliary subunit
MDVKGLRPETEMALGTPKPRKRTPRARRSKAAGATSATEARLVVVGDSDFANNRNFSDMGNGNLFLNCLAWLAQDEDLIAVRPKDPDRRHLSLTKAEVGVLNLVALGLVPGLVALTGILVGWRRRSTS